MSGSRKMLGLGLLAAILMAAASADAAPGKNSKTEGASFTVTIEGIATGTFRSVEGLSVEVEVIEYRDGSDPSVVRKLPGKVKYPNLVLKRGLSADGALFDWMLKSVAGIHDARKVTIVLFSPEGTPIRTFNLQDAFPVKWEGVTVDESGTDVLIESLEIAHEGFLPDE